MAATDRISATEFLQVHSSDVAARRTRWKVPQMLPLEVKMAEETCVHIFNVGPFNHQTYSGSWGKRYIPSCPEDKPWSAMAPPIPGVFSEPIPGEGSQCELRRHEGMFWARDILGMGRGMNPRDGIGRMGVFIGSVVGPKGFTPLDSDLKTARDSLKEYYQDLMREATAAYNISPAEGLSVINERHRLAAVKLNNLDVPWLKQYTAEANQKCPVCGVVSDTKAVMCSSSHCGYIFREDEFKKLESRMYSRRPRPGIQS